MKKKTKIAIVILSCMVFVSIVGYLVVGNPVVFINNQKLKESIKSIDSDVVKFNKVVPFDWDEVYTFEPYSSKADMEEIVGFTSADMKVNDINEGMVHLLFVKDEKVVASVLEYKEKLGYCIEFPSKVTFAQDAQCNVKISNGIVMLTYIK